MKRKIENGTFLSPLPVVIAGVSDGEKDNLITIAWTGIINSKPPKTYISVRPERYSYEMLKKTREFTVNFVSEDILPSCDLIGVKSGRNVDKFALTGLTKEKAENVSAPRIAESPATLECKVTDIVPLGSHDMFVADIVGVYVNENLFNKAGKIDLKKAKLVSYVHGEYMSLGKALLKFGGTVKKKRR